MLPTIAARSRTGRRLRRSENRVERAGDLEVGVIVRLYVSDTCRGALSDLAPPDPTRRAARRPTLRRRARAVRGANPNVALGAVLASLLMAGGGLLYFLDSTRPMHAPSVDPAPILGLPTPIRHVITIFLENEPSVATVLDGPFERHLATQFASASNYHGLTGNSIVDYLDATSGADSATVLPVPGLVDRAGETWAAYMESMPTPCDNRSSGVYSVAHDPFVDYRYVTNSPSYCAAHVLNLDAWNASVAAGTLPNYVWITPNMDDDGHNTSVAFADRWLAGFLSPFLNSSLFSTSVVFVTYDSNASGGGAPKQGNGPVYFVAVGPYASRGFSSMVAYSHYNLLTTTEWLLGLGRTNHYDNWTAEPPMTDLFDFAATYPVRGTVSYDGDPVAGAIVRGDGYTATTASNGTYELTLPNGTYTIAAFSSEDSCGGELREFTVSNYSATVNFELSC